MSDLRSIVDRELERVELRPFTLDGFHRRRDRKRRNQRIAAGGVGVAVALVLIAALVGTSIFRSRRIPASTPSPTLVTPSPTVVTLSPVPVTHAGGLTFATESGIVLLDGDARGPQQLVLGDVTALDWSPDGSQLAYTRPSHDCSLWVLDADSGLSRRLTSCGGGPRSGDSIDWSPDGTQIAFVTGDGIHMIASDGTGERVLEGGGAYSPTWAPDGTRIAFIEGSSLNVIATDGTGQVEVRRGVFGGAAWSPDGATIAILRDPPIARPCTGYCYPYVLQVWLIRLDGSHETKLAVQQGCCIGASPDLSWSPDGSRISLTGSAFQVIDVRPVTARIADRPGMVGHPSWRPVPSVGG